MAEETQGKTARVVPYCEDCQHVRIGLFDWLFLDRYRFARCAASEIYPSAGDMVVQRRIAFKAMTYCSVARQFSCGREGKFFAPKARAALSRVEGANG